MTNCEDWIEFTTNVQFILPKVERRLVSESLTYIVDRQSFPQRKDALNRLIELGYMLEEAESYIDSLEVMRRVRHVRGFIFEL